MPKNTNTQEVFYINSDTIKKAYEELREALSNKFIEELGKWKEIWDNDENSEKYSALESIEVTDVYERNMLEVSPSFNAFALSLLNNGITAEQIERDGVINNGLFKTGLERFFKDQSRKDPESDLSKSLDVILKTGNYKEKEPSQEYTKGDYMLDLYDKIEEDMLAMRDPEGPYSLQEFDNIDHDMMMLGTLQGPFLAEYTNTTYQPDMTHESVRASSVTTPLEHESTMNSIFAHTLNQTALNMIAHPENYKYDTDVDIKKNQKAVSALTQKTLPQFHRDRVNGPQISEMTESQRISTISNQMLKMLSTKKEKGGDTSEFTCVTNALRDLKEAYHQNAAPEVKSSLLELAYAKCARYEATAGKPSTNAEKRRMVACKEAMKHMKAMNPQLDVKMKAVLSVETASMEIANIMAELAEKKNPQRFENDADRLKFITKLSQSSDVNSIGAIVGPNETLESLAQRYVPAKGREELAQAIGKTVQDLANSKKEDKIAIPRDGAFDNAYGKVEFFNELSDRLKATHRRLDGSTQKYFDMVQGLEATTKYAQILAENPNDKKAQLQYADSVLITEKAVDAYLTHKQENNNRSKRSEARITLAQQAKEYISRHKAAYEEAKKQLENEIKIAEDADKAEREIETLARSNLETLAESNLKTYGVKGVSTEDIIREKQRIQEERQNKEKAPEKKETPAPKLEDSKSKEKDRGTAYDRLAIQSNMGMKEIRTSRGALKDGTPIAQVFARHIIEQERIAINPGYVFDKPETVLQKGPMEQCLEKVGSKAFVRAVKDLPLIQNLEKMVISPKVVEELTVPDKARPIANTLLSNESVCKAIMDNASKHKALSKERKEKTTEKSVEKVSSLKS